MTTAEQTSANHPDDWSGHGLATRAIHAGSAPDPSTGAVIPPIYQTSTFIQDGVGELRAGYDYSRAGNPTRDALQECLAALEGGEHAYSFSSGLAAEDALFRAVLRPGDHMLIPADAYGGTFRLINTVGKDWGISHTPVNMADLDAVRAAITPQTRLIWCETPTNPLLTVADIADLADIANNAGILLAVDNTFATPALQNPIALGAHIVAHSTTKYLGGHSDVIGGAIITAPSVTIPGSDKTVAEAVAYQQFAVGAVSGPFDAWLTLRGVKTLAVRMERHSSNALAIAERLEADPRVTRVLYPGLASHPQHATAVKQMNGTGGMVSFEVESQEIAKKVCESTKVFTLAESLGGIESLIELPGLMTHMSVAGSDLEVPNTLIRLSVGIESAEDLLTDLDQALTEATK